MRQLLLVGILTLASCSSCTSWRTSMGATLAGASQLAADATAFEKKYCANPRDVVKQCIAKKDPICKPFKVCERFVKSLMTFNAAVLTAQHALLQSSTTKPKAEALIAAAMESYGPIKATIEGWAK